MCIPKNCSYCSCWLELHPSLDTGCKLNAHKTLRRRLGRRLKVVCTLKLRFYPGGPINSSSFPSKHFNVGSTLFLGWYDVATSHNVKSTLKQRFVCQRWNLQCRTTLKQRCVFQRWTDNVRQRRNNVVMFNVDFHNVGQRRTNVANMTIWKKYISLDSKIK